MSNNQHPKPILVGVDGSSSSIDALRFAGRLSDALGHPIEAMTAWDYPAMAGYYVAAEWEPEQDAEDILDTAIDEAFPSGVPQGLVRAVRNGSPARVLVEASSRAEMLVVGSRGRGGFVGLLLGSVSATCAEHARCPVLVMHSALRSAAEVADGSGSAEV
jgi:nucleotide-binding universal stress UspA family protein